MQGSTYAMTKEKDADIFAIRYQPDKQWTQKPARLVQRQFAVE